MADNKKYVQSDAVKQAQAALKAQQAQRPGAYQSQWQQTLNDTINKIQNREKFSYDLNGDALYQQYKDRYIQQGQQAMMDTMGQAAMLTGGYGNSYAQQVGQQTYQGYLQGLNDMIPDFYNMALQRYQMEGDALMDQYGLLADRDNTDYGRYMDGLNNYYTQMDLLMNQYNNQLNFDYGQYRDATADSQWQAEFDENMRRYNQEWAAANAAATGSGGSGGSGGGYDNGGLGTSAVKQLQNKLGVTADGMWGSQSRAAAKSQYGISDPVELYKQLIGKGADAGSIAAGANSFTGSTYSEASAYLKNNGYDASGLMTSSEWARHKNNNNSAGGEHEASSYQEYLAAYVYGQMN